MAEKLSPNERMENIRKFVRIANDRLYRLRQGFETSSRPLEIKADVLPDVFMEVIGGNGDKMRGNQNKFGRVYPSIGGFNNVHKRWRPEPMTIGIMFHHDDRGSFDEVCFHLKGFLNRRNFRDCPFSGNPIPIEYGNLGADSSDEEMKELALKVKNERVQCVLA